MWNLYSFRSGFLVLGLFSFFLGCQKKDYYTAIQNDHTCLPGKKELTPACRASILAHAPIDKDSFLNHSEQLEQVVQSLYYFMSAPIQFPKDQKVAGVATLEEMGMYDFLERIAGTPNPNQALLNYVLNASPTILHGCPPHALAIAHYEPSGIRICRLPFDRLDMMATLLHEARHSETGPHEMFCPDDGPFVSECDFGFDGPFGWQIGLSWGLIQGTKRELGNQEPFLSRADMTASAKDMFSMLRNIYGIPKSFDGTLLGKKNRPDTGDYLLHIQSIENLSLKTYPTLRMISWQLPVEDPQSLELVDVIVADWNGEERQRLLTIRQSLYPSKVSFQVYQSYPDHTLRKYSHYERKGEYVWAVRQFNWNHDRYPDLVYVFNEGLITYVGVLENQGDGSFQLVYKNADVYFDHHGPKRIEVADMDQDGDEDIVIEAFHAQTPQQKSIQILFRHGGGFESVPIYRSPTSPSSSAFAVGDINHDGLPDVLLSETGQRLVLIELHQARHPQRIQHVSLHISKDLLSPSLDEIQLLDFDFDGRQEFFLKSSDSEYPNSENLLFFSVWQDPISAEISFPLLSSSSSADQEILFADLNHDQMLDRFALSSKESKIVFGREFGQFTLPFKVGISGGQVGPSIKETKLLAVDLDRNGFNEVVAFQPGQNLFVFWNLGFDANQFVW